jgi:hypothetical protein
MIACAQCGTAIPTPTGRASRKRYCNVDCRKAAWRERHRGDVVPAVPLIVPGVAAVPTAFPDHVPTPGGQHRCPHCRQPLAIISVVIPADAATVRPPEAPPTAHNSANLIPPPGEDDLATLGNFDERQHREWRICARHGACCVLRAARRSLCGVSAWSGSCGLLVWLLEGLEPGRGDAFGGELEQVGHRAGEG